VVLVVGDTVFTAVVAPPGSQVYVEPPVAVNVAVFPIQIVALFTFMVGKVLAVMVPVRAACVHIPLVVTT